MPPWQRIRDRKLVQWGLAYLAGAWLALQAITLLGETYGWPAEILRAAPVVLAVGFLAVLVLAWYHGEKGFQRASGMELMMLAGILVLAGVAVAIVGRDGPDDSVADPSAKPAAEAPPVERTSVAVLPFVNVSGDPEQEYFSDGLTEELLNALAQVQGLRVAARTSSFAFKGQNVPVDEIGKRLRVAHVLEGSVRRSGDRLRITSQLVDAANGYHIWSETYDREMADVFAIQEEIARSIAAALEVELADAARASLARRRTTSLEAHDLYLLGLHHWNRRSPQDLTRAIELFEQAIEEDPGYALVYAGLAMAYAVLPSYTPVSVAEAAEKGRAAAQRALELDPSLAEAHAALGDIAFHFDRDWAGADAEHRRAIELNPAYATVHYWRWEVLIAMGRFDEAEAEILRAVELDPLSPRIRTSSGTHWFYRRRYDQALQSYRRAIELEPVFAHAFYNSGRVYALLRRFEEAAVSYRRWAEISGEDPDLLELAVRGVADPAQRSRALDAVARFEAPASLNLYRSAELYTLLGDHPRALDALERAYEQRQPDIPFVAVNPIFEPLHGEPRFRALVERLGLTTALAARGTRP